MERVCKSGQAVQAVGLLYKPEANGNANYKEPEASRSRSIENTGRVLTVGQVFFPLDEELALPPGSLTPRQQEHLAHLATWMPFARAAHMLERLLGVQVSESSVRRETERAGALYAARQTRESQQPAKDRPEAPVCEQLVISTDGAYVPLIKGEWAEVRTVAIGEIKDAAAAPGQRQLKTWHHSYFSRMIDAATFELLAEVEMRRRGVSQAKEVCAVTDGAEWRKALS